MILILQIEKLKLHKTEPITKLGNKHLEELRLEPGLSYSWFIASSSLWWSKREQGGERAAPWHTDQVPMGGMSCSCPLLPCPLTPSLHCYTMLCVCLMLMSLYRHFSSVCPICTPDSFLDAELLVDTFHCTTPPPPSSWVSTGFSPRSLGCLT